MSSELKCARCRTSAEEPSGEQLLRIPDALLNYLREHAERVVTRQELASGVWKLRLDVRSRVIDQTISQVRKRLEPHERILTSQGYGYVYREKETALDHGMRGHRLSGVERGGRQRAGR